MTNTVYAIVALHVATENAKNAYFTARRENYDALAKCGLEDAIIDSILNKDKELYSLQTKWLALNAEYNKAIGR